MVLSGKTILRAACFAVAAALSILGTAVYNGLRAEEYRRRIENAASCSIRQAAGGMNALCVELKKSAYAGTPAQMAMLSAKIWKESSAVKAALEGLPAGEASLAGAYRFLSQAGDYSMYLSGLAAKGLPPSQQDRRNMEKLMEYSAVLTQDLRELESMISSGAIRAESLYGGWPLFPPGSGGEGLGSLESGFEGYPVLIYDGPFSDGLETRVPEATRDLPRMGRDEARAVAARFLATEEDTLRGGGDEVSRMPSYTFFDDSTTVGVTMNGGLVTYLSSGRQPGAQTISIDQGRELALQFLEERGVISMTETYYQLDQGVLTVNFAWYQDGVTCYTDLIKVGVAMDNGEAVLYDARDFIGSHRPRQLRHVPLPPEVAAETLADSIEPKSHKLALIPTPGGGEVLTWEFLCHTSSGENVLVYVNAETGAEERILLLIENENGTLAV